jgi:hypothetical protein
VRFADLSEKCYCTVCECHCRGAVLSNKCHLLRLSFASVGGRCRVLLCYLCGVLLRLHNVQMDIAAMQKMHEQS